MVLSVAVRLAKTRERQLPLLGGATAVVSEVIFPGGIEFLLVGKGRRGEEAFLVESNARKQQWYQQVQGVGGAEKVPVAGAQTAG